MKVTIERETLLKSLNHVQGVVERRNTIPVLSNILITAAGESVKFTATDLDISIVESAPAIVDQAGSITAPAHLLYDIVRKLPDGTQISIEKTEDTRIDVRAGRSQFTLQALPADDFPNLSSGEMSHNFTLDVAVLRRMIEKTRFAISTEETRYYLNGIYFHTSQDDAAKLCAVATDGHRLAKVEIDMPDGAANMPGIIIPRKTVGELHKLLDNGDDSVAISLSDSKIEFRIGQSVVTSKLIDGNYPDYNRVIPDNNQNALKVESRALTKAVDRVSTVANDRGRAIKLALKKGVLTLEVNNPESGHAEEELLVEYDSVELDIGFNAKYMLDVLNQLEGDEVEFLFAESIDPVLVKDQGDVGTIYVLMPMRV
ncbi:MAG: DNA polymerase III subunit beta [Rhizobiales bacterium]|nr:DNA polymerase III subunit beta [Hyphomicrobiales bacterium]NRB14209.1 DNA polymerase III subunit beta [Hyphomicrobiales bacterium]